jgi:hypothetical protein
MGTPGVVPDVMDAAAGSLSGTTAPAPAVGPPAQGQAPPPQAAQQAQAEHQATLPEQTSTAELQPKKSLMSDILHAVGEVLGGPSTTTQVNPQTGAIEKVPLSRSERIANTSSMYLRAMAAGAGQHGPGHLGKAAAAGAQATQQFQQQQQENTLAQSQNVRSTNAAQQQKLLTQASLAKASQESARWALDMKSANLDFDQKQLAIVNARQKILNQPGVEVIQHFDSNNDINDHLEAVGPAAMKQYAVDLAHNDIQLLPNPKGGFDAVKIPKGTGDSAIGEGMIVHRAVLDPKTNTVTLKEEKAMPSTTWDQYSLSEKLALDTYNGNKETAQKLKEGIAKIGLENAQAGAARAEQKLRESQTVTGDNPLVKEIGEGKMPVGRLGYVLARKPELMAAVAKEYPDFDGSKIEAYTDAVKQFESTKPGTAGYAMNSGGTALSHLHELDELNTPASHIPHTPAWTKYHNKLDTVAPELAKFYGDVTIPAIQAYKDTLGSTLPGNRHAAITTQVQSMGRKLDEYEQQWKNAAPSKAYEAQMPDIDAKGKAARAALDPEYAQRSVATAPPPAGATHIVPGPDGKNHYTNAAGTADLGVAP